MNLRKKGVAVVVAAFAVASGQPFAEPKPADRVLGLWQSNNSYLELNIDGTFFSAEHSPQDDLFGTYVLDDNVVRFTYNSGETVRITEKIVHFSPTQENSMQLVDTDARAISYRKLRDF